ncbi:MAG: hypothetical protein CVV64_06070 [Candidatus Wallbacteria bacterium HGW-Wallbacteria-1]|jgi:tetratricopeptide (TPR) repeat protein|uniref:Uncharacterized protein n=1 Tax=Candidatus Wallbacteria bacterium HGW-Wallbacteria-1 TaxID=2013854 RepID=A0A2N1PST6_9BACT|nr:MAG: hypothetical protein CVV64_06070 [Candidatus Wallbacteria bacterium HGW-Wallbacteria-1]
MDSFIQYFKSDPEALIWLVLVVAIIVISFLTKKKTGNTASSENYGRLDSIMGSGQGGNGEKKATQPLLVKQSENSASAQVGNPLDRLAAFGGNSSPSAPVASEVHSASSHAVSASAADSSAASGAASSDLSASASSSDESKVQTSPPTVPASAQSGEGSGILTQYKSGNGQGITEVAAMLEQDPNNLELLDWLAFMYYSNNMLDEALATYTKALTLDPENVNQLYYLGSTYFKMGGRDEAVECWKRVVELKPDSKIASKAQAKIDKSTS